MAFTKVKLLRGFTEIKEFYELAEKNKAIICGGYPRFCASPVKSPVKAGDVDFFPTTQESEKGLYEDLVTLGFTKKYENHVSITMETDKLELDYLPVPQIIKPVIEGKIVTLGTPEEILENFDFTIVRAAIISPTEVLVDEDFIIDESKKRLRLKNIHCPISSLLRCCKYARKGYWMGPAEALRLFMDWDERGDEYKIRMVELFNKSKVGEASADNPFGMTQEEIDELEALLRID